MIERHIEIWERDYGNATRVYAECGCEVDKAAYNQKNSAFGWDLDHIWPSSRNGSDSNRNLQVLCMHCNRAGKADDLHGHFGPKGTTAFEVKQAGVSQSKKIIGRMETWEDDDDDY